VIHASSVAVTREHRRVKTDRLDTELLKRGFLGWLRGERGHCKMVAVHSLAEEDAKRPGRERGVLVAEATRPITRLKAAFVRLGIRGFNPKLKTAPERLGTLLTPSGEPISTNTLAGQKRDMARHRLEKVKSPTIVSRLACRTQTYETSLAHVQRRTSGPTWCRGEHRSRSSLCSSPLACAAQHFLPAPCPALVGRAGEARIARHGAPIPHVPRRHLLHQHVGRLDTDADGRGLAAAPWRVVPWPEPRPDARCSRGAGSRGEHKSRDLASPRVEKLILLF
jgi:hypothetical protein